MPPQAYPKDSTSSLATTRPISPHNSSTPLITEPQRQALAGSGGTASADMHSEEKDSNAGKRSLFGLVKKKDSKKQTMDATPAAAVLPQSQAASRPLSPLKSQQPPDSKPRSHAAPVSPARNPYQQSVAAQSPSRLRSSSPRLHSPASSEIFERNVQEPIPMSGLGGELNPAHIPAHVITEDQIPPALEASAQAITNDELNPDEVEIVTSSTHQPASSVLEGSASHADLTQLHSPALPSLRHEKSEDSEPPSSMHASGIVPSLEDDGASNYGQLDPNDVRRLSFISFKDIVQSEHQHMAQSSLGDIGSRDSLHIANALPPTSIQERAASPLRSPRSPASTHSHTLSAGVTTPPAGVNIHTAGGAVNPEQSPARSIGLGSPGSQHGELTIETMRQALRKTASSDLSGVRSAGMSPVNDEQHSARDPPRSRTNT
ncbi:hypothetical protein DOTSEDRAFT_70366 [Dothistroma septosporum NZE10]|uniref:Uncharacterized protein n=1 Tax=Dothistroma septosporum (strain NZE10 / CBS 128990) TaxID=675120 RepID=N1PVB1_DOTSN|nr:hypothetical protein DOTSEDRAFT_70366 [Dothistroma septosporum NZE10]